MIDVHCHLNFHAYKHDVDEVIQNALKRGVTRIINVGTKVDSSQEAVKLAEKYDELYAIVGIHPHHADKHEDNWLEELDRLAPHPKVLAIGEVGLDFYRYKSNGTVDPTLQRQIFIEQIKLASRHNLPLQIHNRHAGEDIIKILKEHKSLLQPTPGMFHCFAGTTEVLKSALQMGFYIGFDGNITYPGLAPGETVELRDLAIATTLDRIVIETDAPFLTPIPHRGKRNMPEYAIITAQYVAELKGISYEKLVEQTDKNVYTLFSKLHTN